MHQNQKVILENVLGKSLFFCNCDYIFHDQVFMDRKQPRCFWIKLATCLLLYHARWTLYTVFFIAELREAVNINFLSSAWSDRESNPSLPFQEKTLDHLSVKGHYLLAFQNTFVFMDIAIDGEVAGRLLFELYSDVCPKTSENFRALCTGERGMLPSGLMMHYLHTPIHRVVPNGWIQAGGSYAQLLLFYKMRVDLLYIIHLCSAFVCFCTFCLLTVRKIVSIRAHSYLIALRKNFCPSIIASTV